MAQNDQALLTRLKASGLDFVVIGGVCVVYHGVPVATFDLEFAALLARRTCVKLKPPSRI